MSNVEVVTLAAYLLGGEAVLVDIEDIAVKAFDLAPSRFCWRKYPERIDLRAIQYALKDACRAKVGLLSGSIKRGYMLSAKGSRWAQEIGQSAAQGEGARKASVEDLLEHERQRLRHTAAFGRFIAGETDRLDRRDFEEFARVNDYFPEHVRGERFTRLDHVVTGDDELTRLWSLLRERFLG